MLLTRAKKIDNTQDSQLVPHATTNRAFKCLTSEIERDQVLSQENGRQLICGGEFRVLYCTHWVHFCNVLRKK